MAVGSKNTVQSPFAFFKQFWERSKKLFDFGDTSTITDPGGFIRWSAINGGRNNRIDATGGASGKNDYATIGGGNDNEIAAPYDGDFLGSTISGGFSNTAWGYYNTIGGGKENEILGDIGNYSFIGGGNRNKIQGTQSFLSTIVGGRDNIVQGASSIYNFIGGGFNNQITGDECWRCTIVGGQLNTITGFQAGHSFIGGGQDNDIVGAGADHAVIVGGKDNHISGSNTARVFIGGGEANVMPASVSDFAVIVGGWGNSQTENTEYSFIGGGYDNDIRGKYNVITGGRENQIDLPSSAYCVVSGGYRCEMQALNNSYSFIGGGQENLLNGGVGVVQQHAVLVGGKQNQVAGALGSILGGEGLKVLSYNETAAGRFNDSTVMLGVPGTPSKTTWNTDQLLWSLGIGTSDVSRANAVEVFKNGKVKLNNLPTYADNAAAVAGGEPVNMLYKTATGELRVVV